MYKKHNFTHTQEREEEREYVHRLPDDGTRAALDALRVGREGRGNACAAFAHHG